MNTTQNHPAPSARTSFAAGAVVLTIAALAAWGPARADASTVAPAHDDAAVSFVSPADGDHVAGVVHVEMAATGVTIEAAGEAHHGAGHFHVIVDAGCVEAGQPVPRDADHVHFGAGQAEGDLYLTAGEHTLCLQLGDGTHIAESVTSKLTIDVGIASLSEWCKVSQDVEALTDAAAAIEDVTTDDGFTEFQDTYAKAARLVDQLGAGLDQVDPAARPAVADMIGFFADLTDQLADAADASEAQALVDAAYADAPASLDDARTWMGDTCDVDTAP